MPYQPNDRLTYQSTDLLTNPLTHQAAYKVTLTKPTEQITQSTISLSPLMQKPTIRSILEPTQFTVPCLILKLIVTPFLERCQ
jgi:hypothetical protein